MKNYHKFNRFLGEVNVYRLSFLRNSMTEKLIEHSNEYVKTETRNANIICCGLETLDSIWQIRQNPPQEAI
jgi:hypothetical protein